MEIRKFGQGALSEEILLYPHPSVRISHKAGDPAAGVATYLHSNQLGSVRVMTGADGASNKETTYRPFGETVDTITDPTAMPETKGFIGERFDTDSGLQYLNARYYDPKLGMFIQPDWFEVTMAGVGTNRYAYCNNDPINCSDPNGNFGLLGGIIGGMIGLGIQGLSDMATGNFSGAGAYVGAAAAGAFVGSGAGIVGGGIVGAIGLGAGAGMLATGIENAIDGDNHSYVGGAIGGALGGGIGYGAGRAVANGISKLSSGSKGKLGEGLARAKQGLKGYKDTGNSRVGTGTKTPTGRDAKAWFDHTFKDRFGLRPNITGESKFGPHSRLSRNQTLARPNVVGPFGLFQTGPNTIGSYAQGGINSGVIAGGPYSMGTVVMDPNAYHGY